MCGPSPDYSDEERRIDALILNVVEISKHVDEDISGEVITPEEAVNTFINHIISFKEDYVTRYVLRGE